MFMIDYIKYIKNRLINLFYWVIYIGDIFISIFGSRNNFGINVGIVSIFNLNYYFC